jgi:hypothetical protein
MYGLTLLPAFARRMNIFWVCRVLNTGIPEPRHAAYAASRAADAWRSGARRAPDWGAHYVPTHSLKKRIDVLA